MIAAVGLWGDIRQTVTPRQTIIGNGAAIELPRGRGGHYYLTAEVNGTPVDFVIDTGATDIVLTQDDARRVGLNPDNLVYLGRANTANGQVRTAPATLEQVRIGGQVDDAVRAVVNEGEMDQSLLGMSYLQRFASVEITGGKMILRRE